MRKVLTYKNWKIYFDKSDEQYKCFLPGQAPTSMDSPEWEGGSVTEIQDFIDSY